MQNLRITKLQISDLLGFEEYELTPGRQVTVIEGDNGEGKTSIVTALQAILEGGSPAKLVRNGKDRAEIVLEFDNGMKLRKSIPREGSATLTAVHPEFGRVSKPQTYLDGLFEDMSVNIAKLMDTDASKRVDYVLRALPLELDRNRVSDFTPPGFEIPEGHPLTVLPRIRKAIEDRRREQNVLLRDKKGHLSQLEQSIPTDAPKPGEVDTLLKAKLTELSEAREALRSDKTAFSEDADQKIAVLRNERVTFVQEGERILQDKIDALKLEWYNNKTKFLATSAQVIDVFTDTKQTNLDRIQEEYQPKIDALVAEVSRLETEAKQEVAREATRQHIESTKKTIVAHQVEWERLNDKLIALDAYHASLANDLPIPGLAIENGDLTYNGIPWATLNTAEQMKVAFKLGKLKAGPLGLIRIDGTEVLSDTTFPLFVEEAVQSDLQVIMTRVAPGPLSVKRYPEELDPEPVEESQTEEA